MKSHIVYPRALSIYSTIKPWFAVLALVMSPARGLAIFNCTEVQLSTEYAVVPQYSTVHRDDVAPSYTATDETECSTVSFFLTPQNTVRSLPNLSSGTADSRLTYLRYLQNLTGTKAGA